MPATTFHFSPFQLSEDTGLMRNGEYVEVGQKALTVLIELARAEGQPVSKAKLLETCWPNITVEEGNLTVQIAALRKALGQTEDALEWIVTVPRVGYRLVRHEVTDSKSVSSVANGRSIAVLPFHNLSADKEDEYFAASLSAEVTSALARYKSLSVQQAAASGADQDSRRWAAALGVSHLVEGSAMRSGSKVRIVVSLIDGPTGAVIWNNRLDADFTDIFAVQDKIAATVATSVEPAISGGEIEKVRRKSPANLSAHELYLKAKFLYSEGSPESMAEAYSLALMALQHDPQNRDVNSLLCHILHGSRINAGRSLTENDQELAEYYAKRCIELADGDARVMAGAASALLHLSNDYQTALAAAETAYKLNPNDWSVITEACVVQLLAGDLDLAIERYLHALGQGLSGPPARFVLTGLAHAMILQGHYERAIAYASDSFSVSSGPAPTHWMLVAANAHLGQLETARKWLSQMQDKWPSVTVSSIRAGQPKLKPERIEPILQGLAKAGLPLE